MENTKVNGVVWDSGTHHLYVDNKPASMHVPPESIIDTYNQMKMEIKQNESIPIGIDHLNKDTFKDNDILKKLDLLHVGDIHDIEMIDGAIVLKEAAITNPTVADLYHSGELPAFSPVGSGKVSTCPKEGIDYKLDSMVIDRVDFVQNGGCETCIVHNPPLKMDISGKTGYIKILQQKNEDEKDEVINMTEKVEKNIKAEDTSTDNSNTDNTEVDTKLAAFEEKIQKFEEQLTKLIDTTSGNAVEAEDSAAAPEGDVQPDFDVEAAVQKMIDDGLISEEQKDTFVEIATKLGEELFTILTEIITTKSPDMNIQGRYSQKNTETSYDDKMKFAARKYFRTEL